jgi:hypothetical protein
MSSIWIPTIVASPHRLTIHRLLEYPSSHTILTELELPKSKTFVPGWQIMQSSVLQRARDSTRLRFRWESDDIEEIAIRITLTPSFT